MSHASANRRMLLRLGAVAVAMFAFGIFAMPPLYDRFCEWTGLGEAGIKREEAGARQLVASDRQVRVLFNASTHSTLSWDFEPTQPSTHVTLGEPSETLYLAMNPERQPITGRAVYNVSPPEAALYFVKTDCFCYTEQELGPLETREMPVYFYIQPELPDHITEITLSYVFFGSAERNVTHGTTR